MLIFTYQTSVGSASRCSNAVAGVIAAVPGKILQDRRKCTKLKKSDLGTTRRSVASTVRDGKTGSSNSSRSSHESPGTVCRSDGAPCQRAVSGTTIPELMRLVLMVHEALILPLYLFLEMD